MGDVQIRLACWAAWKSAWKVEKWGLKRKEEKSGGSSPGKAPLFGLVYSFSATLRAFLNSKDEIEESANKWMQETAKLLIYSVCEKNFFMKLWCDWMCQFVAMILWVNICQGCHCWLQVAHISVLPTATYPWDYCCIWILFFCICLFVCCICLCIYLSICFRRCFCFICLSPEICASFLFNYTYYVFHDILSTCLVLSFTASKDANQINPKQSVGCGMWYFFFQT